MRKPSFAGLFYPREKNELINTLTNCFLSSFGPGSLSSSGFKKDFPKAIIVPHAGFSFSGMCAAHAYKILAESDLPDLFILIGPSHSSNFSGICSDDYSSPLGIVETDKEFAEALSENSSLKINNEIHLKEHCLEVQIPFLQFVFKHKISDVRILPILISRDVNLDLLSKSIKQIISDLNKKVVFIISSDFTHQGPDYGFVPFLSNVKHNLHALDMKSIDLIKKSDINGFENHVMSSGTTICGFLPIVLLLKTITFKEAELLSYYTSGDVLGDYTNSVSYASIVFR